MSEVATTTKRRMGRPTKTPRRGVKRVGLGLKVSAETKRRLDRSAEASGLSQSQEAERRIELSYNYERVLGDYEAALSRLGEMKQGQAEQVLRSLGWQSVTDL